MKDTERRIRTLRELPRSLEPAHDLWPQIQAQLQVRAGTGSAFSWRERMTHRSRFAAAAALALLATGLVSGWWWLHAGAAGTAAIPAALRTAASPQTVPVIAQEGAATRLALLRSLNARLLALPPPTQQKVRADLQLIERSIQDIQTALGRDPGNALLHEMLRETQQDEQHLATTVQEAGVWTEEASGIRGKVGS